jgi:ElaB/YqjD/DUF883 family membrane-anchored ribosome-binding protein
MSNTSDLAPNRRKSATVSSSEAAEASLDASAREAQLEEQISQLQSDLKGIASTLAKLGADKATEVKAIAGDEVRHLKRQGQYLLDDAQDQVSMAERQLKDAIREKPLTAVASALGIGYILALLTRH